MIIQSIYTYIYIYSYTCIFIYNVLKLHHMQVSCENISMNIISVHLITMPKENSIFSYTNNKYILISVIKVLN